METDMQKDCVYVPSGWWGSCLGEEKQACATCIGAYTKKYLFVALLENSTHAL